MCIRDRAPGMRLEPLHPVELVVEFRAGRRIAVREIDRGDAKLAETRLDIARLAVGLVAGQGGEDIARRRSRQECHAVIAFLPQHRDAIAHRLDLRRRKILRLAFDLLQAKDVGLGGLEPVGQMAEPRLDRIDVPGRDLGQGILRRPRRNYRSRRTRRRSGS